MRKFRGLRIGFFILFLVVIGVNSGCSGIKAWIKEKPAQKTAGKEMSGDQAKEPSSQLKAPSSEVAPEVSKVEKLAEPRMTAPTPTQPQPQPPVPPSPLPAIPPAPPKSSGGFVFNFDNADLYEVIRVMGDILKINYLIDPKVKGVVNIHTSGQISVEDVFPIFQTILNLNGATAIKKDNLYEIVPFGDAKKIYTSPMTLLESAKLPPEERYTIQIIPLKYIPVSEVSKMIKPFLSDGADIVEHPPHNILLIGDITSNVKKCLNIIGLFDIDIFTDLRVRVYPIVNADVTEIAKEMEKIFSSFEVSLKSGRGVGITFTPIIRINSLLVVSSIPNIFENVERWLKELDKTPKEESKLNVFVYYVQNGKAKDMADVLKQVYAASKDKKAEYKEKVVTSERPPGSRGVKPPPTTTTPTTPATEEAGGLPEGEINIVVDETTNALIIRTYARDYKFILETIKKLDLYPKQVLIEVFLAEVTLDDTNKFGLEWSKFSDSFTVDGKTYNYTLGIGGIKDAASTMVSGIRYSITDSAGKLAAAVHASATDNRLRMISSPNLLASNNKEAKIQIGTSQPILTSTYSTTTTGVSTGYVEGTIEYKDVGIIITVTPRISDGGLVTMEISIEDSKVETTSLGNLSNVPVFKKKTVKTTLSIMGGQTIVIGGLIEESKDATKSGVPLLSKIPLLGSLFGYQTYGKTKTELVLLLTPHVITDLSQSNTVTREFREKVEIIKKDLEKKEKK